MSTLEVSFFDSCLSFCVRSSIPGRRKKWASKWSKTWKRNKKNLSSRLSFGNGMALDSKRFFLPFRIGHFFNLTNSVRNEIIFMGEEKFLIWRENNIVNGVVKGKNKKRRWGRKLMWFLWSKMSSFFYIFAVEWRSFDTLWQLFSSRHKLSCQRNFRAKCFFNFRVTSLMCQKTFPQTQLNFMMFEAK